MRVLEIISNFIKWSRECGSVYNHVVRVIYLHTPGLWEEILSRFVDVNREIRSLCIEVAKMLLKTRDVAPLVCDLQESLADRLLYDPDPMIRLEALNATFEIASVYIERICNPYLIKALSSRIGDKEMAIRIEAMKGVSVCFKDMLLINNPKVIKVRHVFKMSSAVLWLYKEKVTITDQMKNSWRSLDQKIHKIKLSTGSPIDLPDQDAGSNLDINQIDLGEGLDGSEDPIARRGDDESRDADQSERRKKEVVHADANRSTEADNSKQSQSQFFITELEKREIETALSDNLIDVTNEDSETKSANILVLITYSDTKALISFSHLLFSQCKLRQQIMVLLGSTRADESFYSSFKFICSKFDYLDNVAENLNKVLLDLRNDQNLVIELEDLFNCKLILTEAVEVANRFVVMASSSPSSDESDQPTARAVLKEHMIIRSGVFFIDAKTLVVIMNQIKTFDKSLTVRMSSFIYVLTMCYPALFTQQEVKNALMTLSPRIHLILIRADGVNLDHLPRDLFERMMGSAERYLKAKRDRNQEKSFLSEPSSTSSSSQSPEM